MNLAEIVKKDFTEYRQQAEKDAFFTLREQAFAEFEKLGFPTTRHEEWKYTSLKSITEQAFTGDCLVQEQVRELVEQSVFRKLDASLLVFVNGSFANELSRIHPEAPGIVIGNMARARHENAPVFHEHFGRYAQTEGQALNALNTALLGDGAFIYVPANAKVARPVVILSVSDSSRTNVLSQPRNLVVLENSASATVVEAYCSTGSNASFTNALTEAYVGENAHLEHYKIQNQAGESYQNNFTQFFQEAGTNINHVTLTLDGAMVRNNLHFYMNGENGNSLLYGLYINDHKDFVDNHTRVDHAKPNCFSDEKYKGILRDQSAAVFNGKIIVHLDAQKTNAYQRNQNILLSDEATVNTKPQLEIFADDVKCTHGATIGQLEEEPLFYLRSRGIPEDVARRMLLNAFAADIAEKIKIPELVGLLEQQIAHKL